MWTLYNPPRKPTPDIEIISEVQGSVGTAGIFHFTDYVELIEFSFMRSSFSNSQSAPAQLSSLSVSFLQNNQIQETRELSLYFADGLEHDYTMMLTKPQGVDELQLSSSLELAMRIESRLIFKQEVPNAVGLPNLIHG